MERERPTGFVARCQCGQITGALNIERTDRQHAAKMLGGWLMSGRTVEPRFGGTWSATLAACRCVSTGNRGDE